MFVVTKKGGEEREPLSQSGDKNATEKQAGCWDFCKQPGTGAAEILGRQAEAASQHAHALAQCPEQWTVPKRCLEVLAGGWVALMSPPLGWDREEALITAQDWMGMRTSLHLLR